MNKYDYISKPVSLSEHYSGKYKKHIYIFGDIHVNDNKCPKESNKNNTIDLIHFLKKIIKYTPKLIDFYFEIN